MLRPIFVSCFFLAAACSSSTSTPVPGDASLVAFAIDAGGFGPAPPSGSTCSGATGDSYSLDLASGAVKYSFCQGGTTWQPVEGQAVISAADLATVRVALQSITETSDSQRGCADCGEVHVDVTTAGDVERFYDAQSDSPSGSDTAKGVGAALDALVNVLTPQLPSPSGG